MTEPAITVSATWLLQTARLLNTMAGEGIGMCGCTDPADLMCALAEIVGAQDADDMWEATVAAIEQRAKIPT